MTFHGITEEGKEALGDGEEIFKIHCLNSDKVTFPLPVDPYNFVEEVPHSSSDQFEPKRYYFEAAFIVSETVALEEDFPQVLELEFRTPEEIPIGRMNYRLPIPDALQVQKYAEAYASGGDNEDPDFSPGAMAFMPSLQLPLYTPEFPDNIIPEARFGYLTLQEGGVVVWDTHTDTFQQPAYSDLAVVNYSSLSFSILFGSGDGTFDPSDHFSTGWNPRGLVAGEFNGDGRVDLAIITRYHSSPNIEGKVHIFLGLGDGTFYQLPGSYEVGIKPNAIKAGDFDGDRKTDLVVANYESEDLTILYGVGDGTFEDLVTVSCNGGPMDVVVTKINGDQDLDLVVALFDVDKIASYRGWRDRTGPFSFASDSWCGLSPVSLAAGLFDPDWVIDIAVVGQDAESTGKVRWLEGLGGGLFELQGFIESVGEEPVDVVAILFDDDDWFDLIVASAGEESQELHFLKGDMPAASFTKEATLPLLDSGATPLQPTAIAVGHFNEDDYKDLAVSAYEYDVNEAGHVLSILGKADGSGFDAQSEIIDIEMGQNRPVDLAAIDFNHQFTDAFLLPNGRNCGYGALIVPEPVTDPETLPSKAYLFVTNHTIDPESTEVPDCEGLEIDGKRMADIVSVYEIDPSSFTPTADRPFNDKLVASIRVGCGPQGIAESPDGLYIYVSNAYEGSVTVIDFADCTDDCLLDLLPSIVDPVTPISGIEYPNIIRKEELLDDPPGPGVEVINRSIATFKQIVNSEKMDNYAWVTMSGYETGEANYPGSLILLDLSNPFDPEKSKTITGLGEFTIGVATMPEAFTFQTVVVSDGHPESDPNGNPDSIAFIDSYDLINKCSEPACYDDYKKKKTLTDGKMSSSIAFRRDGHRAYLFRDAPEEDLSGLLVIDARPGVPVSEGVDQDEKVLGALSLKPDPVTPNLDVFWAAIKHEECARYDPVTEDCTLKSQPKLYLSVINDDTINNEEYLKGLWQRPEPLVIPGPPYSVMVTSDDAPSSEADDLERTFYIQDGGIVFNDELTHAAFSVETTPQKSDYPGDMDIIVKPLIYESGSVKKIDTERFNWTNITIDNMGTDFSNMDVSPIWSPLETVGIYHYYNFLIMSGKDTGIEGTTGPDTDLYVIRWNIDEGTTERKPSLMNDENYCDQEHIGQPDYCGKNFDKEVPGPGDSPAILDGDPHWYWDGQSEYTVLFTRRMPKENSIYINELWMMELYSDFSVKPGTVKQLTDPCFYNSGDPDHAHYYVHDCSLIPPTGSPHYGDYDPKISPLGGLIAFERHIGPGDPSDWDIIIVSMDFKHWSPVYEGAEATIWNVTQHFDVEEEFKYDWSAEFIPYWKPGGIDETVLTYTVMTYRTDYIADDFRDQFVQNPTSGEPPLFEPRYKRPLEDPGRSDNLIDGRGGWFPDADDPLSLNPELVFFREIGSTEFVAEQAKRIPGR